ncbi:MAG: hypothetical protein GEV00_16880 [Actinophytocola sp.]|nr:hypothetical protein [Actinophytocola sp.]
MFMQIIQGPIRDADAARTTMDRWLTDLESGAEGWLGGTFGVTDDDMFVAAVRFESEEAARRNSERPEQGEWWREMEQHFSGPVTFHDCKDVIMLLGGGSDDAGFVQVVQGQVADPERARSFAEQSTELMAAHRPDIIGATIAIDDDGCFTETVAFTTEDAAREGERKEMPAEVAKVMSEGMATLSDVHYLDLHHPWFASHHERESL